MSGLVDMHGRSLDRKQRPITAAQAGAIITSEIDIAVERWNEEALRTTAGDEKKAHIFKVSFDRYQYSEEAAEKAKAFGYAKLSITVTHQEKTVEIYQKGLNFAKESELDNTNGYYPGLITDCIGFLLASGLLYNLALSNPNNRVREPRAATKISKPGTSAKG